MNIKNYLKSKRQSQKEHNIVELTEEDLRPYVTASHSYSLTDFKIEREKIYQADLVLFYGRDRVFVYKNRFGPTGNCEPKRELLAGMIGDMVNEIKQFKNEHHLKDIIINIERNK